jgi:hypothetical protein
LRGAPVGVVALLLTLGGLLVAPAAAQGTSGGSTTTTADTSEDTATDDAGSDELPTCAAEVAGLELATTLDFADVARSLAPEGSTADPTGDIVSYELYCPYGDLEPSAPSDAAAPLELLLSWGVVAAEDGPGCFEGGEEPAADGTTGVVGDPDRRAQVDWAITTDDATDTEAIAAAEELLALAPSDTTACEAEVAAGTNDSGATGDDDGSSNTKTPLLVIGAAAAVALLAGLVLLVRQRHRRRRGEGVQEAPGATPGSVPAVAAVGPSPSAGPLVAGAAASQRAARTIPPEVRDFTAAAGAATSARATAVVAAARRAGPSVVGAQAAALALVAAAAGTLADADARRHAQQPDEQVAALAAALGTLARSAGRSARRAATANADAPSTDLDALVRATTRLLEAHRRLLSPPAQTETPR